jgi:hypothetical protein
MIRDQRRQLWARVAGANALSHIGNGHREAREHIAPIIKECLELVHYTDPTLIAFVIAAAVDLNLEELEPMISSAYKRGLVEEVIFGTADEVLTELKMSPTERKEALAKRAAEFDHHDLLLDRLTGFGSVDR